MFSAGVPTVWLGLLQYMTETNHRFTTLKRTVIGGSACPPAMIRAFETEHGVEVLHAWGMTEMSPLGTVSQLKATHQGKTLEDRLAVKGRQGRAIFGVDLKIVDGAGRDLPWDGKAFGDLLVQGPWIAQAAISRARAAIPCATAGSRPATSPPSMKRATSRSPTAPRT